MAPSREVSPPTDFSGLVRMLATKIRRPLPIAIQIAALSLGVSATPLMVRAEETPQDGWVWGVAAREAALVEAVQPLLDATSTRAGAPSGGSGGIGVLATSTGAGVLVAILDTGIDLDHPEFAGRIDPAGTCFGGSSVCSGAGVLGDDDDGHGTHVAGILAAANDATGNTGVAPDATLLPVKVLGADGSGSYGAVAQGISYAASQGAQIINMSLGGPKPTNTTEFNMLLSALKSAAPTSVIVAAAGNEGGGKPMSYPAAFATQPGVAGSMIIAGSLNPSGTISRFSVTPGSGGCTGPRTARVCFKDVFLVAPGENIYSTLPGGTYGNASGTSMATPYIAGAAALVWSAAPYLTPAQVANILFTSAIDLGRPGTDTVYGRGLVNPAGALAPLGSLSVATSGPNTQSRQGTGQVSGSQLGGVMAFGLRSSHAAKDLVFFDSFDRDYRVDLTKSVRRSAVSFSGVVGTQGPRLRAVTYFGEDVTASALYGEETGSLVAFSGRDGVRVSNVRDAVATLRLSTDTAVTVGYKADVAGRINQLDLAASEAFDGMFLSATAMNSPYLSFSSEASLLAASFEVAEGLTLSIGHVAHESDLDAPYEDEILTLEESVAKIGTDPNHLPSGQGSSAAVAWQFAPSAVLGFNVAYTGEANTLFGGLEAGALALTGEAQTMSAGAGLRVNLGGNWIASASWSAGVSRVTPLAGGLFANVSDLSTTAYGAAIAKRGIFGTDDALGFGVSRPLHVVDGSAILTASTGVTAARDIIYSTETINLASATPETDFEIGYTAALGEATFLQANAIYQLDLGGVGGDSAIAGIATLSTVW